MDQDQANKLVAALNEAYGEPEVEPWGEGDDPVDSDAQRATRRALDQSA